MIKVWPSRKFFAALLVLILCLQVLPLPKKTKVKF